MSRAFTKISASANPGPEKLIEIAARRLERAAVDRIIDGPAVAREMFDWSEEHARKTTGNRKGPFTRAEFMSHVDISQVGTGCWIWQGVTDALGYGRLSRIRKSRHAHRFGYELHKGPIASGACIDHLCRNPRCVNTGHLEAVSLVENVMRGMSPAARCARQTHCKNGHAFEGSNVGRYRRTDGRTYRFCVTCRRQEAARTSKSPLEIKSDKPLLFWGADQGQARDADRAAADVAMASLRRGVAR